MKKSYLFQLLVFISLILVNTNCTKIYETNVSKGSAFQKHGKKIEVVFSNNLSPEDLIKIQFRLKKENIDLVYKQKLFSQDNKLMMVDFTVDCNDGFSGGAACYNLTAKNCFGFYRDKNSKTEDPFGTGNVFNK